MAELLVVDRADTGINDIFGTEQAAPTIRRRAAACTAPAGRQQRLHAVPTLAIGSATVEDQRRLQALHQRLIALTYSYADDFGSQPRQVSVQAALGFFQRNLRISTPGLSVEPSGRVIATWRRGRNVLTMRFAETSVIHWALAREVADQHELRRTWGKTDENGVTRAGFEGSFLLFA